MTVEGFKFFQDAEGFSAFDINAFLMSQSVTRFDNSTDRDTALSSVLSEGMVSYDKSTNVLQFYDGSAWQTLALIDTDHGGLSGLADDDHPQYLNEARGDARYYTETEIDALFVPAGSDGQIQYNNGGAFGGAAISYDDVYGDLSMAGHITAQSGGADGGIVLGQAFSSSYVGLRTAGMAEVSSEYVLISDGTHTFVSSGTGGLTRVRGPANDSANEIIVSGSGVTIDGPVTFDDFATASKGFVGQQSGATTAVTAKNGGGSGTTPNSVHQLIVDSVSAGGLAVYTPGGTQDGYMRFGLPSDTAIAGFRYEYDNNRLSFRTNGGDRMYIDSSGRVGIGDSTPSYTLDVAGTIRATGAIYNNNVIVSNTSQTRDKIRVWSSSSYCIGMQSGYTYGHLGDYAMTFQMNNDSDRGFWWGDASHSNAQGAMSLTTNGRLTVATSLNVGLGESTTSGSTIPFLAQSTSSSQVADIYRTGSAPGNSTSLLVHSQYGNHSWGVVGEFRIEGSSGTDKPAILFSSAKVSTTWTVGYDYTGHEFGIRQNRGYRNGGWGTNRVLIDTVGRLTINTDSGNLQLGPHNTSYCHFFTDRGRYYFDVGLTIDTGIVSSYNENLSLRRADSEKMRIDDSITYSWHRFRAEIGGGTSVYWYNQGIQSEAPSGYKGGLAMSNLNSNTHTGQFRYASNTCYLRSYNDGAYRTLAAIISNQSSGRDKQDIVPLFASSTAGSMTNELLASGIEVVKQLRPVEYRWKKEKALDPDLEGRREKALHRLDEYRAKKGLEPFASEETEHDCGRDRCEGTAEEPCLAYRNWERGEYGFIAQEVGDVIPQVTRISEIGENESIDALGLVAICVKALQELSAKVESLETKVQ